MCVCVGVNKYRCLHDSREEAISTRQLPWDIAHPSRVIPPRYMHWVKSQHKSYNIPPAAVSFLCLLIYHLQAARRWLYSFYPYLNTNQRPAQHGSVRLCLHLSHSSVQGLVPNPRRQVSHLACRYVFTTRNFLLLTETSIARKNEVTKILCAQNCRGLYSIKTRLIRRLKTLFSGAKMVFSFSMRFEVAVCVCAYLWAGVK